MSMHRPFAVVTTLVLAIFFTWAIADAQTGGPEDKGDTKKAKGTLPAGWKKLDLTAKQKDAIYTVMGTYKTKIKALEMQIKELKDEEYREMVKLLTDAQKKQLAAGLGLELKTDDKKVDPAPGKK